MRHSIRTLLVVVLSMTPMFVQAAGNDRITVENDSAVTTFRVTSEGDVHGNTLSVQQGSTEAGDVVKFVVKDSSGNDKTMLTADGAIILKTTNQDAAFDASRDGSGSRFRVNVYGKASASPVFIGRHANGAEASPAATLKDSKLFTMLAFGHDGSGWLPGTGLVTIGAEEDFSATSAATGIYFMTTPSGSTTRAERVRIAGSGNVGIGTSVPEEKLEVNGGIRINTTDSRPTCDEAGRGTFWFSQGGTGVRDRVEVCAKDDAEVYAWRTLW